MQKVLLVKYGEISLRKGNRAHFEHLLMDGIRARLSHMPTVKVRREQGRFLIENIEGDLDCDSVLACISRIFGIIGFCHAIRTKVRDIPTLCDIATSYAAPFLHNAPSFRVHTRRSDKSFPGTSTEIAAAIGEAIHTHLHTPVDLHNPSVILWMEIRNDIYFYVDSAPGVGGLPYGASGRGILLLSGGFDSPVAGYLAARRGVALSAIYFHSPPFVSPRAADKAADLANQLAHFTGKMRLYTVPFTDIQVFLKEHAPLPKLTILMKRAMLHIATALAQRENALCLVTGDAVGQVASQTIHSLAAMETATHLPILRPLTAMDKHDIIELSRTIGTHDISARPYDDCCTLFLAKHPEVKPAAHAIEKIEARLMPTLAPLMEKALQDAIII
jgi:thiamine biosynthesis protein ThiI